MADYDLAIIGGGASAHSFLLGLPEDAKRKTVLIAPMSDGVGSRQAARERESLASPKMNNPQLKQSAEDWNANLPAELAISGEFNYLGFGNGGGTRFWGNSIGIFDRADLVGAGLDPDRMRKAYSELGRHLPIWGNVDDMHSEIYQALQPSEAPFRSNRIASMDGIYSAGRLRIGTSRNAVHVSGERACTGCSQCINGCPIGALWQSDAAGLAGQRGDVALRDDWVRSIVPASQGYQLRLSKSSETISARRVVLAVDPVACFALLAPLVGQAASSTLAYTPALAWLAFSAKRQRRDDMFGLAHSQAIYTRSGKTLAFGHIFDGYPMTLSSARVLSEIGLVEAAFRGALPNAILGNMFFPSPEQRPQLTVSGSKVVIEASPAAKPAESAEIVKSIRRMTLRNGMILAATRFSPPGSDLHYAGGIPDQLQTDTTHETQLPGVFVVGGAAMQSLPPQSPTLTFMAAAFDLATRWQ